MTESWTFTRLARADRAKHEELVLTNPAPAFSSIVGWEWKGWNCLYPLASLYMKPAGFQRFMKGFFRRAGEGDPDEAEKCHGYNIKIKRGAFEDPWEEKRGRYGIVRHGFYDVHRAGQGRRFGPYAQALFLNYGVRENGIFDGRDVRDFVVEVTPDLLLGKAYFKIGPMRMPASFFILERAREHSFTR